MRVPCRCSDHWLTESHDEIRILCHVHRRRPSELPVTVLGPFRWRGNTRYQVSLAGRCFTLRWRRVGVSGPDWRPPYQPISRQCHGWTPSSESLWLSAFPCCTFGMGLQASQAYEMTFFTVVPFFFEYFWFFVYLFIFLSF